MKHANGDHGTAKKSETTLAEGQSGDLGTARAGAMNHQEFAEYIRSEGPYTSWHGVAGYDTCPYLYDGERRVSLPVAYWSGNACNHVEDEGDMPEGDLLAALTSIDPDADVAVVLPLFSGSKYQGEDAYVFEGGEWHLAYHIE